MMPLPATMIALFAIGLVSAILLVEPVGVIFYASYAGVGGYLAVRRPDNVIGPLLIIAGCGLGFGLARVDITAADLAEGLSPLQSVLVWLNGCGWPFGLTAIFALMLVFPSGRWPIGREGRLAKLGLAIFVAVALLIAILPTVNVTPPGGEPMDVPNPLTPFPDAAIWDNAPAPNDVYAVLFVLAVAGVVSLFLRYAASTGLERLQYRWFLAAIVVVVVATASWVILTFAFQAYPAAVLAAFVYTAIPIAVTIAVMRYRLFEIDRIVSRTIGWAVITTLLTGVFVAVVVGLQTILTTFTSGNTLAVAASTLIVFGLFQPVRRRVQAAVDRRFDRARVDAERTVEALAGRLRDDVDLDAVRAEVIDAVDSALRPTTSGMWLRRPDRTT